MNLNPKPSAKRRIGKLAALSIRKTKRNGKLVLQLPPAREKRNVPSKTPRTRNRQRSPRNNKSKALMRRISGIQDLCEDFTFKQFPR